MSMAERERRCAKCGADVSSERGTTAWYVNWDTYGSKWLCSMCALAYRLHPVTGEVLARAQQKGLFDLTPP